MEVKLQPRHRGQRRRRRDREPRNHQRYVAGNRATHCRRYPEHRNLGVTWTASKGTVSSSGLYQAPSVTANTVVTVTATSVADPTKSSSASVTVTAPVKDRSP